MTQRYLQLLLLPARILPGLLFLLSGFLKGIDPWGTAYKIEDYLSAFGMSGLDWLSMPLSLTLSAVEMVLGAALLAKLCMKAVSTATMLLSGFFTLLTLWIALTNPVSDCGCFGDALLLSNWATFFKNLGLILCTGILFLHRGTIESQRPEPSELGWIGLFVLLSFGFTVRNISHLPLFDFRPYSVGTDLYGTYFEGNEGVASVPTTHYLYEKNGKQEAFEANALPDSSWRYIETRTIPGFTPSADNPLLDFYIADADGVEKTDSVLNAGYVLLFVAEELSQFSGEYLEIAKEYRNYAEAHGISLFLLTSSPPTEIRAFSARHDGEFALLTANIRTLRTMIRSNPGLLLLGSGVVLDKWHKNDLPPTEAFGTNPTADALRKYRNRGSGAIVGLVLFVVLFMGIAIGATRKKKRENFGQRLFF